MFQQTANPNDYAALFVVPAGVTKEPKKIKFFWLCSSCQRSVTVVFAAERDEIGIAPLQSEPH